MVNQNAPLPGRLVGEALDVERLRSLWGRSATVEGMVHFKHNGQPRLIEARRVRGYMEGDSVFREMPAAEIRTRRVLKPDGASRGRAADFMKLWGTWPGEEPLDDLLAQLD